MAETATKLPIQSETKAPAPASLAPWAPFDALRHEIDRVFEGFAGGALRSPLARPAFNFDIAWPRDLRLTGVALAVDVAEKEKSYEITAEAPGLDAKDIEVKVANGTLTIRGEKKAEKEKHDKDYVLSERRYGAFVRSFRLPEGADADRISAAYDKGVLTVTVPKTDEARRSEKTIDVKTS